MEKARAQRNRTIVLSDIERYQLKQKLTALSHKSSVGDVLDKTFNQDLFVVIGKVRVRFIKY